MEWTQQSLQDMTFTFVTAAAKGSSIEKLSEAAQKSGRPTLPEQTRMSVWFKKPNSMKIITGDYKVIVRPEGRELFSYQYSYATGQTSRQKLSFDSWPVWPSPARIITSLKKMLAKNTPHTIVRDDAAPGGANYILTFRTGERGEERAYVIRIADWQLLKSVFYENGQPSFVAEWRDITVNTGLADKIFDPVESPATVSSPRTPASAVAGDTPLEIVYAGIVKKQVLRQQGGYRLEDNGRYLRTRKFVEEKDSVTGALGTAFGFVFTVRGNNPLSLTARYLHPPLANPLTREVITRHENSFQARPGETEVLSWVFTKEWEIVPGEWILQLWEGDKKLAEKVFVVTRASNIYASLGEWGRRLPEFNAALKENPDDARALNGLGNAYSEMGDYPRAIEEYTKAINADPRFPSAYNGRCDVYTLQGEYDKAIADCSRAIELKEGYIFALINRGRAYNGKGDDVRAMADYNKAIELNPRHANAYFYRGLTLAGQGDTAGAKADFEKVLELNPYDARARKKLEEL